MTDYDTRIPVTAEARDIAREAKRDGETWDEYIRRCADAPPEVTEYVNADAVGIDADTLATLEAKLNRIDKRLERLEEGRR